MQRSCNILITITSKLIYSLMDCKSFDQLPALKQVKDVFRTPSLHKSRVNVRIQSEYSKIRTRKNSVFGYFSRSHNNKQILILKPREHLATIEIMWHIPRNLILLFFGRYQLFMMFICLSNSYSHMDFVTFKAILMLFYKMVGELACIS